MPRRPFAVVILSLAIAAPAEESAASEKSARFLQRAAGHWAYQPLAEGAPPEVADSAKAAAVRNEIDRFVIARLEAAGLAPSPEADRGTLVRRLFLDLTGLPPSPEEAAAFVGADDPGAYEALVDRLLASPRYGERWGRHWLDLARYADSSGFHNDLDRPHAWRYRDYVIRSFNEDKPYARFVAEQLAGDEVPWADEETLVATGFCRNGPSNDDNIGPSEAARAQYRADQLDGVLSTASAVFLGSTIGCARCHDHKTEAFTARDYYAIYAIFNGTERYGSLPRRRPKKEEEPAPEPEVQALIETSPEVPPTHLMIRGLATELGEEVPPGVPAAFSPLGLAPLAFPEPGPQARTSGRRLAFAEWIASPGNALTWRVLANRVWHYHFGRGIVATPSDFGFTGAPPTHPELLDWLARELVASGGRLKPLHRQIVLSATYRQASDPRPEALAVDPDNELLWRANLKRKEAEALRDSILAAAGTLNPEAGGPGVKPRIRPDLMPASRRNPWPEVKREDASHWRRSVYVYTKRQLPLPILELFDAPATTDSCEARRESVVPTQALVLMNDEFVEEQAAHLARRALAEAGDRLPAAVDRLLALALATPPAPARAAEALAFVREREAAGTREEALADLAHVVFNSSAFLYVP
jgi:hypothetical protein